MLKNIDKSRSSKLNKQKEKKFIKNLSAEGLDNNKDSDKLFS